MTLTIITLAAFSGCLGGENNTNFDENSVLTNKHPRAVISAPDTAYFGEEVVFDASQSTDPDGTIVSYLWDFSDFYDTTAEGAQVTHTYELGGEFIPEYPVRYYITLQIYDNDGSIDMTSHEIALRPKEFIFYLNQDSSLSIEEPPASKDTITARLGKISQPVETTYNLQRVLYIPSCTWTINISIKKPLLTVFKKISIVALDETGAEITQFESDVDFFSIWKEKTIRLTGSFPETNFSGIKLTVYGFTLKSSINLLYGEGQASCIRFDFT